MSNRILRSEQRLSGSARQTWILLVPLLLAATLFSADALAKIYKWVDADGVTQYTQHPPPEEFSAQEIKTQTQNADEAARAQEALQKRIDSLDERREDKKLASEEGEAAVVEKKELDKFCSESRQRLSEFKSGRRLAQKQEDGSFVPVTEEHRQEEVAKLEKRIKEQCS